MAALPNIDGVSYKNSLIPCLVPRRKVWLTPTARLPCSNADNIGERKTWTQSEFCTWQNSFRSKSPGKCLYCTRPEDGAKHRAKFGWRQLSDVGAVMKPTRETRSLKFAGVPKLVNRSQPLMGRSSPYCDDMWKRYCCLSGFFRLSICALVAKIQPDKVVRWCPDGDFLATFCVLYFQRAACSTFQTCILNSH